VLVLVALAARWWVAARTWVPDWDGVHYLWLAQRAADGDAPALFQSVFPPGYPAVVAAVLRCFPGLDPQAAAQWVGAIAGAATLAPLWYLGRACGGRAAALGGCVLFALGIWFVRHPADCLSEAVFFPLVAGWALAVWWSARERCLGGAGLAGLLAGCAFATRPEGGVLLVVGSCWLVQQRRLLEAVAFAAVGGAVVGLSMWGWATWGPGWVLSPKAGFVFDEGVGSHGVAHYGAEWLRLPGALLEALGVALLLGGYGVWAAARARSRRSAGEGRPDLRWLLLAPLVIQCFVAPALKSHFRFFTGFGVLLLPFAGIGLSRLAAWIRLRAPAAVAWVAIGLCLAPDLVRLPQERRADRIVERELGALLADRGVRGGELFTDMPRVAYYAGLEPPPPRRLRAGEVETAVADPRVRWIAVVRGRTAVDATALDLRGFEPFAVPAGLRDLLEARSAEIWHRR